MSTTSCGLFNWRPQWLQCFATKQAYVIFYVIIGVIQGMSFTYLSSVLSTVERQFGIKSKEAAWIFSGNEISQIFLVFLLPFLNRIKRRTLWTSIATVIGGFGILLCSAPFFWTDKAKYEGGWTQSGVKEGQLCGDEQEKEDCSDGGSSKDYAGMIALFFGFVISGVATSFYYAFGIPYVDDNVPKDNSPMFLGFMGASRTLGPALGFVLGSACLKLYVVPGGGGALQEGDPGWLGAWWLGWLLISVAMVMVAPFLALFPQRLPTSNTDAERLEKEQAEEEKKENSAKAYIEETKECAKRIFKKKVWVFNSISTIITLFGFIGFGTFVPKYFEFHFRQSASSSGASGGLSKALGSCFGMIISGFLISKYKFRARTLAAWNLFIGVITVVTFFGISFLACPPLHVLSAEACGDVSSSCSCSPNNYNPVCSTDGVTTFFNPCAAGCTDFTVEKGSGGKETRVYSNCACATKVANETNTTLADPWWRDEKLLPAPTTVRGEVDGAVQGYCPSDCSRIFYTTLGVLMVVTLLASTGRIGTQIIAIRVLDPRDKAAAMVIMVSALSLFAFLPSPIVFGEMMDNACIKWGIKCGVTQNCLLYDTDKMRQYMLSFVGSCLALATLVDVGVLWNVGDLELYDTPQENKMSRESTGLEMNGNLQKASKNNSVQS